MDYQELGAQLAQDYYSGKQGWQWVLYEDFVPHDSLRGVEWCDALFDRWVGEFFIYQNQQTKLIPVGGSPRPDAYYCVQDFSRLSPIRAIHNLAQLVDWHRKPSELQRARDYARNALDRHRYLDRGWFFGVDATTGLPCADTHNITDYGLLMHGCRILGLDNEADAVQGIVSQYRERPIPERWTAYGPIEGDWSSDGCYFVRCLPKGELRDNWQASYCRTHYARQYGHATTHAGGDSWYSDGIVNQLIMHVHAGRYDLFDQSWRALQRESVDGLVPAMLVRGKGSGGPHKEQWIILEALVERAEVTQVSSDIYEAKRYADLLIETQAQVRANAFSRDLLRLARLLEK